MAPSASSTSRPPPSAKGFPRSRAHIRPHSAATGGSPGPGGAKSTARRGSHRLQIWPEAQRGDLHTTPTPAAPSPPARPKEADRNISTGRLPTGRRCPTERPGPPPWSPGPNPDDGGLQAPATTSQRRRGHAGEGDGGNQADLAQRQRLPPRGRRPPYSSARGAGGEIPATAITGVTRPCRRPPSGETRGEEGEGKRRRWD
jgi:hypothetical protein